MSTSAQQCVNQQQFRGMEKVFNSHIILKENVCIL